MIRMLLGNVGQMLVPNPQQLFLRMLARMLDVDALFMRATASDNKLNSSHSRTPGAARDNERLMLVWFTHIF